MNEVQNPKPRATAEVRRAQSLLRKSYEADPAAALVVDHARSGGHDLGDPFHTRVEPNKGKPIAAAIHAAHGGPHDEPTPGDLLCAALGVCQELTLRLVASVMGIELDALEVETSGEVDVRGSLGMGGKIGFRSIHCRVSLRARGATEEQLSWLCAAAERFCVVGDTLRSGVPVKIEFAASRSE
jgi:uncharacterized OsmC-like protein